MALPVADRRCLGGEKKHEAFVLRSPCVIFAAAAAGFEGDVNSGVSAFVLPDYEA